MISSQGLLVVAVAVVGVLHTAVPDHWAPIALLARTHRWSTLKTAQTAVIAGLGHVVSTLIIALIVWGAGAALAARFGHLVSATSSVALIGFGLWIAIGSWMEIRSGAAAAHAADAVASASGASHHPDDAGGDATGRKTSSRTALLLILGSSPMIEGIPAFFAAGRYGPLLLATMAVVFAASTIATYVALCVGSASGMARLRLGRFETYGEIISGSFIAVLGVVFLIFPAL